MLEAGSCRPLLGSREPLPVTGTARKPEAGSQLLSCVARLRQPSARSLVTFQTTPADFGRPVDEFVNEALADAGLAQCGELEALKDEKIMNMGILKTCDLNEIGLSVGAKTAITRALTRDKNQGVRKVIKLQREASRTVCRKQRTI